MNRSTSPPQEDGSRVRQDNVVLGFAADPWPTGCFAYGIGYANTAALGAAVIYGCVDWFDYANHLLTPEQQPAPEPIR